MAAHVAKKARTDASQPTLRVGGVPEHFNYPWRMAEERGLFDEHGVRVQFVEQTCGTGAMIQAVKDGDLDVIVALTEGLVADIASGSDLRLLGTYVSSPLCWAISAGAESAIHSVEDLKGATFGVSRMTSGSHLMAYVLASQRGWDPQKDLAFEVKGNFKNLRDSVNDGSSDAFMWETFTTKPFHDSGEIRRIGDITTPWPCFMLAASKGVVDEKLDAIRAALAAIHVAARAFHREFATMPQTIAEHYNLKPADAKAWYAGVHISAERFVSEAALQTTLKTLHETGVIKSSDVPLTKLIDPRLAEIRRDIKSIKLYNQPELLGALHRRLAHAGLASGSVSYTQLLPFDQHHYYGTDAVDWLIDRVGIAREQRIVNIGSGLGGPARYLAGKLGCQVLACELQEDLHSTALELTVRTGLSKLVHHMAGDFLTLADHLRPDSYDRIVSWLTVLHITDRASLFRKSYELLRPGGIFFAADFFQKQPFTDRESELLKEQVACPALPTRDAYCHELEAAGFKVVDFEDATAAWTTYTRERATAFKNNAEEREILGEQVFSGLLSFYELIAELFEGGHLGGVNVIAKRSLGW